MLRHQLIERKLKPHRKSLILWKMTCFL